MVIVFYQYSHLVLPLPFDLPGFCFLSAYTVMVERIPPNAEPFSAISDDQIRVTTSPVATDEHRRRHQGKRQEMKISLAPLSQPSDLCFL